MMVLVHLMGGLGNQLFQYAAGKALSIRLAVPLKLYFEDHYRLANRSYALGVFDIEEHFPTRNELNDYLPAKGIERRIKKLFNVSYTGKLYRDKELFCFDNQFMEIRDGVFLSGFWQNKNYFESIEHLLRKELVFKVPADYTNQNKINEITSREISVSIHVRRTDYTNPASGLYALPTDYYSAAIKTLEKRLSSPPFYYVFSDDVEWALQNFMVLLGNRFELITNNREAAHEDLRLMAACHHHILANSSFSWWAAWLNTTRNKIVVAPKEWMKGVTIADEALFTKNDVLI
jgi:hypothetical protein